MRATASAASAPRRPGETLRARTTVTTAAITASAAITREASLMKLPSSVHGERKMPVSAAQTAMNASRAKEVMTPSVSGTSASAGSRRSSHQRP